MSHKKDIEASCPSPMGFFRKLHIFLALLFLPSYCVYTLFKSPFVSYDRHKSWTRVLRDACVRYSTSVMRPAEIRYLFGGGARGVYEWWAKKNGYDVCVESVEEGTDIFYFGKKNAKKVVVYLHGGVFVYPLLTTSMDFWNGAIQGRDIRVAVLDCPHILTSPFPTQLRQAILALQHIFASGVSPSDVVLTGDSAGSHVVLQVLSHILHPVKNGVSPMKLATPFRGVYLMSPWTSMTCTRPSFMENALKDALSPELIAYACRAVLAHTPKQKKLYIEPCKTPDSWFMGVEGVVGRVLVTAGGAECLRDDVMVMGDVLGSVHGKVEVVVKAGGVNADPGNELVWGWIADVFRD